MLRRYNGWFFDWNLEFLDLELVMIELKYIVFIFVFVFNKDVMELDN